MDIAKTIFSTTEFDVVYTPDVVFARRDTGNLTLQLVTPVAPAFPVQASAVLNPVQQPSFPGFPAHTSWGFLRFSADDWPPRGMLPS